jgi:hypothetical protein
MISHRQIVVRRGGVFVVWRRDENQSRAQRIDAPDERRRDTKVLGGNGWVFLSL